MTDTKEIMNAAVESGVDSVQIETTVTFMDVMLTQLRALNSINTLDAVDLAAVDGDGDVDCDCDGDSATERMLLTKFPCCCALQTINDGRLVGVRQEEDIACFHNKFPITNWTNGNAERHSEAFIMRTSVRMSNTELPLERRKDVECVHNNAAPSLTYFPLRTSKQTTKTIFPTNEFSMQIFTSSKAAKIEFTLRFPINEYSKEKFPLVGAIQNTNESMIIQNLQKFGSICAFCTPTTITTTTKQPPINEIKTIEEHEQEQQPAVEQQFPILSSQNINCNSLFPLRINEMQINSIFDRTNVIKASQYISNSRQNNNNKTTSNAKYATTMTKLDVDVDVGVGVGFGVDVVVAMPIKNGGKPEIQVQYVFEQNSNTNTNGEQQQEPPHEREQQQHQEQEQQQQSAQMAHMFAINKAPPETDEHQNENHNFNAHQSFSGEQQTHKTADGSEEPTIATVATVMAAPAVSAVTAVKAMAKAIFPLSTQNMKSNEQPQPHEQQQHEQQPPPLSDNIAIVVVDGRGGGGGDGADDYDVVGGDLIGHSKEQNAIVVGNTNLSARTREIATTTITATTTNTTTIETATTESASTSTVAVAVPQTRCSSHSISDVRDSSSQEVVTAKDESIVQIACASVYKPVVDEHSTNVVVASLSPIVDQQPATLLLSDANQSKCWSNLDLLTEKIVRNEPDVASTTIASSTLSVECVNVNVNDVIADAFADSGDGVDDVVDVIVPKTEVDETTLALALARMTITKVNDCVECEDDNINESNDLPDSDIRKDSIKSDELVIVGNEIVAVDVDDEMKLEMQRNVRSGSSGSLKPSTNAATRSTAKSETLKSNTSSIRASPSTVVSSRADRTATPTSTTGVNLRNDRKSATSTAGLSSARSERPVSMTSATLRRERSPLTSATSASTSSGIGQRGSSNRYSLDVLSKYGGPSDYETTSTRSSGGMNRSMSMEVLSTVLPERTMLRRQRRLLTQESVETPEQRAQRLNQLYARISGALTEVKGVLKQYSTETETTEEAATDKKAASSRELYGASRSRSEDTPSSAEEPVKFRFVRKIRRRSTFDEEEEEQEKEKDSIKKDNEIETNEGKANKSDNQLNKDSKVNKENKYNKDNKQSEANEKIASTVKADELEKGENVVEKSHEVSAVPKKIQHTEQNENKDIFLVEKHEQKKGKELSIPTEALKDPVVEKQHQLPIKTNEISTVAKQEQYKKNEVFKNTVVEKQLIQSKTGNDLAKKTQEKINDNKVINNEVKANNELSVKNNEAQIKPIENQFKEELKLKKDKSDSGLIKEKTITTHLQNNDMKSNEIVGRTKENQNEKLEPKSKEKQNQIVEESKLRKNERKSQSPPEIKRQDKNQHPKAKSETEKDKGKETEKIKSAQLRNSEAKVNEDKNNVKSNLNKEEKTLTKPKDNVNKGKELPKQESEDKTPEKLEMKKDTKISQVTSKHKPSGKQSSEIKEVKTEQIKADKKLVKQESKERRTQPQRVKSIDEVDKNIVKRVVDVKAAADPSNMSTTVAQSTGNEKPTKTTATENKLNEQFVKSVDEVDKHIVKRVVEVKTTEDTSKSTIITAASNVNQQTTKTKTSTISDNKHNEQQNVDNIKLKSQPPTANDQKIENKKASPMQAKHETVETKEIVTSSVQQKPSENKIPTIKTVAPKPLEKVIEEVKQEAAAAAGLPESEAQSKKLSNEKKVKDTIDVPVRTRRRLSVKSAKDETRRASIAAVESSKIEPPVKEGTEPIISIKSQRRPSDSEALLKKITPSKLTETDEATRTMKKVSVTSRRTSLKSNTAATTATAKIETTNTAAIATAATAATTKPATTAKTTAATTTNSNASLAVNEQTITDTAIKSTANVDCVASAAVNAMAKNSSKDATPIMPATTTTTLTATTDTTATTALTAATTNKSTQSVINDASSTKVAMAAAKSETITSIPSAAVVNATKCIAATKDDEAPIEISKIAEATKLANTVEQIIANADTQLSSTPASEASSRARETRTAEQIIVTQTSTTVTITATSTTTSTAKPITPTTAEKGAATAASANETITPTTVQRPAGTEDNNITTNNKNSAAITAASTTTSAVAAQTPRTISLNVEVREKLEQTKSLESTTTASSESAVAPSANVDGGKRVTSTEVQTAITTLSNIKANTTNASSAITTLKAEIETEKEKETATATAAKTTTTAAEIRVQSHSGQAQVHASANERIHHEIIPADINNNNNNNKNDIAASQQAVNKRQATASDIVQLNEQQVASVKASVNTTIATIATVASTSTSTSPPPLAIAIQIPVDGSVSAIAVDTQQIEVPTASTSSTTSSATIVKVDNDKAASKSSIVVDATTTAKAAAASTSTTTTIVEPHVAATKDGSTPSASNSVPSDSVNDATQLSAAPTSTSTSTLASPSSASTSSILLPANESSKSDENNNMPALQVMPAPVQTVLVEHVEQDAEIIAVKKSAPSAPVKKKVLVKKLIRQKSNEKSSVNKKAAPSTADAATQQLPEGEVNKELVDEVHDVEAATAEGDEIEVEVEVEGEEDQEEEEEAAAAPPTPPPPAPPKKPRKIKKKVIIKRQQRRLSNSDPFFPNAHDDEDAQPAEVETLERAISYVTDSSSDEEDSSVNSSESALPLKTCMHAREYKVGDLVMYAERFRKTQVRWKRGRVLERITSISYKLLVDGKEVPAHISYIKKYTGRKVHFGSKEYLEIDYEQIAEEEKTTARSYSIWNMV